MKRILAILFYVCIAGLAFGQSATSDILKYSRWECRLDDSHSNILIFGRNNSVHGINREQYYETSGTYEIKGDSIIITERIVGSKEWYKLHGVIKDKELYFVYRRNMNPQTSKYDAPLQLDSTYKYRIAELRSVVFLYNNVEIPIYKDPIGNEVKHRIMQDKTYEIFFAVDILEKSALRYKVSITTVISSDSAPEIIGWVDKQQCGVFKRWYYDDANNRFIKLYAEPRYDSEVVKIYENVETEKDGVMTVVDYADGDWRKVVFYSSGILYEGWVDRYCSDIYDSCA